MKTFGLPAPNGLDETAPEAPENFAAMAGAAADEVRLTWTGPWANGSDITGYQLRAKAGADADFAGTDRWTDIALGRHRRVRCR